MDVKPVECKLIEFVKQPADERSFSKEFAVNLAASIKAEGLHQAIAARPNPAKPGHYLGIHGRHRHYAVKNVLKQQFIECNVITDMDDDEAAMATIAENLWRNPLTKAQHASAIKKWWEYYQKKNVKPAKEAENKQTTADTEAADDAKTGSEAEFVKKVSAATGQNEATVRRTARIAKAFTPEQLEIFDQMKTSQVDMTTIAKIKDDGKRGEVVNLVLAGMEPADAIKEVMKEAAPVREDGRSNVAREAAAAAQADKGETDLDDTAWFDKHCGAKAAMLCNPAKYKADALLFRLISDTRHTFRAKAKGDVKKVKQASGVAGPFWNLVNRFMSISHPKDWHLCPECAGQGVVADPTKSAADIAKFGPGFGNKACPKCGGSGYLMKTEEYL